MRKFLLFACSILLEGCSGKGTDQQDLDNLPFVFPDAQERPVDVTTDSGDKTDVRDDGFIDNDPAEVDVDVPPDDPGGDTDLPPEELPPTDLPPEVEDEVTSDDGTDEVGELCGGQVCGAGHFCMEDVCEPCIYSEACGAECVVCTEPTGLCYNGRCVNCRVSSDCGPGKWCENQQCEDCGPTDPEHCGAECSTCSGETPVCVDGACVCTSTSCGDLLCFNGSCVDCNNSQACGPTCEPCPATHPLCHQGECVQCLVDPDCGQGKWCFNNECRECGLDPQHCGMYCEVCTVWEPECTENGCNCVADSCGSGRICTNGRCSGCDTPVACGPECKPCAYETPYCLDGNECVQCISKSDCPQGHLCDSNHTCVDYCSTLDVCASDDSPDSKSCATAKIVGRTQALQGVVLEGDTTNHRNKDDLPSFGGPSCWDAKFDAFFRVYLLEGEKLKATLTPLKSQFAMSLKLYKGTQCKANWKEDFILCEYKSNTSRVETFTHVALVEGWYTIVADGQRSFEEDEDWGPFRLIIELDCQDSACCCGG